MDNVYEEGKCFECKNELVSEPIPIISIGGAKTANFPTYYCNSAACGRYKIFVRYS